MSLFLLKISKYYTLFLCNILCACVCGTCEGLRARIDAGQPLGRAKIRDLQDAAVGVDENVVALRNEGQPCENGKCAHAH